MDRKSISLILVLVIVAALTITTGQAQWQQFQRTLEMQFPRGYRVTKQPHANSEVVKVVPGPTEAAVKGTYRNDAGVLFFLSDWSWDRRMNGQSHFWILPVEGQSAPPKPQPPAPAPAGGVQVLSQVQELSFPQGFVIVESPSTRAKPVSTKAGPLTANVKAYIDRDGVRFYMSDWSYSRAQEGKPANWMLPLGNSSRPANSPPPAVAEPAMPPGFHFSKSEVSYVLETGFEIVDGVGPNAKIIESGADPVLIQVEADAMSGVYANCYLLPDQNDLRKQGRPYTWIREKHPQIRPGLLPKLKQFSAIYNPEVKPEEWLQNPWRLSVRLMEKDPASAIAALREFGVEPYLTVISRHYDDREFPGDWLKEVARFLAERGALPRSIATLRNHFPKHDSILELWRKAGEGEMMASFIFNRKQFDRRFIGILEAERGNFAAVEEVLSPLLSGWNPGDDGLNASGPRINMQRELARAQWKQGKADVASESTRKWLDAYARNIANNLLHPDYVDAGRRLMEFDSDFEAVGEYFDLLEAVTDPQIAAEIVVGLKGLQLAVTTSQQVRHSSSADPEVAALSRELLQLSEEAQRDTLAGRKEDRSRMDRISEIHSELAMKRLSGARVNLAGNPEWARLSAEIDRRIRAGEDEWDVKKLTDQRDLIALDHLIKKGNFIASPQAVSAKLGQGEVLIDFFELPPESYGEPAFYGALVIPEAGEIRLVGLGRADAINSAVKEFRDLMLDPGPFTGDAIANLQDRTDAILARCHQLMVGPLLEHIETAHRLVICAESQLLFVPFSSLKSGEGELAGSQWEVTYVNAARDLLRDRPESGLEERTALLIGNPDFTRNTSPVQTARSPVGLSLDNRSVANLAEASRGVEFGPLPGTKEEIALLSPKLASAGYRVTTLTEAEATEPRLTSLNESPTILHFATHGFFLNSLPGTGRLSGSSDAASAMLLSGLALTGGQNTLDAWKQGSIPTPGSDGILLASEVSRLDLTGTRTVVLSACETAVGRVLSGEGVEGLRSGLTLAGAESVVLTLWPVGDDATVELMDNFYSKILSGIPASIAMVETKRELFARTAAGDGEYMAHRLIGPFIVTRSGSLDR